MMWLLLATVPNKNVFLNLENKIYNPEYLSNQKVLNFNDVLFHILF